MSVAEGAIASQEGHGAALAARLAAAAAQRAAAGAVPVQRAAGLAAAGQAVPTLLLVGRHRQRGGQGSDVASRSRLFLVRHSREHRPLVAKGARLQRGIHQRIVPSPLEVGVIVGKQASSSPKPWRTSKS